MPRRKTHAPLNVFINNRLAGRLEKEASGAVAFQYDAEWLAWEHRFAVSLSLPLRKAAYRGAPVVAVFENLLPDKPAIRKKSPSAPAPPVRTPTACWNKLAGTV